MSNDSVAFHPGGSRSADGLEVRMASHLTGRPDLLVLTSPWPESIYAYETLWPGLARFADLVAIDLPGFGRSAGRDDLFTPAAMGEFLAGLLDEWEIDEPHLFCPDVGTSAALFAAARHPGRIRSLTVGSGGAAFPLQVSGALAEIIAAPDLSALEAADPREIVAGALTGIERHELSAAAREDYLASYEGDRFARSARYVRSYPSELPVLAELVGQIDIPVQVFGGRHDAFVPPANAEFLDDRLPRSALTLFDTGHYFWEDAASEVLGLMEVWLGGGYHALN